MNPLKSFTTWDAFFGGVLNTNKLCPALVSLVFLHPFFGLAQFCKKPCNPVFNVLQVFKKIVEHFAVKSEKIIYPHCFELQAKDPNGRPDLGEM